MTDDEKLVVDALRRERDRVIDLTYTMRRLATEPTLGSLHRIESDIARRIARVEQIDSIIERITEAEE